MVFYREAVLMSDGRVVTVDVEDELEPIPGESALTDGMIRVRVKGQTFLLRDGAKSKPIPSYFGPGTVKMVAPSGDCLLTHAGEVWCSFWTWGEQFTDFVQDKLGVRWYRLRPQASTRIVEVDGSAIVGCALLEDGRLDCWKGHGSEPILSFPRPIRQVAVSAAGGYESGYHICVLDDLGRVGCWGSGTAGQLGYMAPPAEDIDIEPRYHAINPPKEFLSFPHPAQKIYAFPDQSCALLENGELWCWGRTGFKLKGQSSTEEYWTRLYQGPELPQELRSVGSSTMPSNPIEFPNDCQAKQVVPLEVSVCVLCQSGCVKCWSTDPPDGCLDLR